MITEGNKDDTRVFLTRPTAFDIDSNDYRAPNIVRRILSLFKNIRLGSDLTSLQLPPIFNTPKSHLQCYGEQVYCANKNLLHNCNVAKSPKERFINVVAWCISLCRPVVYTSAPYNPILGETHHASNGSLNVLLEQVSHHPPVCALHATDMKENIEMLWCLHAVPKFYGTQVEAQIHGKRQIKLKNHGETYIMNPQNLLIKIIPPGMDWVGNVKIKCQESDIEAELNFLTNSLIGRTGPHTVKGRIYHSSSLKTLYEVNGQWNSTVKVKDVENGKETIIYNGQEVLTGLKCPVVKDPQGILESESALVWSKVSEGILSKNWEKAREAKTAIEEKQRKALKERNSKGENWVPKYFNLFYTKENGWDCSPLHQFVPPAPIIIPQ